MRILLTSDAVGGVWTYATELSKSFAATGHEVVLAVEGPAPSPEQVAEFDAPDAVEVVPIGGPLEWYEDPWRGTARNGESLLSLAHEHDVDLVHLNAYSHAALPWRVPVVVGAHSSLHSWWRATRTGPSPVSWEPHRLRFSEGLQRAALVVAPTQHMLRSLIIDYGDVAGTKIRIPNGLDPSAYTWAEKEPWALSTGRVWDEGKNFATLDDAAEKAAVPVRVAGERMGPSGAASPETHHLELLGRVPRSHLLDMYSRASVFVSTALYEPFGYGPLEAAMSGCALLLPDLESLRETWRGAALFANPHDANDVASRLGSLFSNPERRMRLAHAARQRAARLTATAMARAHTDAYQQLLRTSEPREVNVFA